MTEQTDSANVQQQKDGNTANLRFDDIYEQLKGAPRLMLEAELKPAQSVRFQSSNFPNLGAAEFKQPIDGTKDVAVLLVDSPQSIANRAEKVCWDDATNNLKAPLRGLPYVIVELDNNQTTNSLKEPHRLASLYVLNSKPKDSDEKFYLRITREAGLNKGQAVDISALARTVFNLDPNSVIHGVFFARSDMGGGRGRLQRLLSGFIEAKDVLPAPSGGTLMQHVDPTGDDAVLRFKKTGIEEKVLETTKNVPYTRTDYVAREIKAFFNFDLALMRGYRLGDEQNRLLVALALYKILLFLRDELRLRSMCELECLSLKVTRPKNFFVSELDEEARDALLAEIEGQLPELIRACKFIDDKRTDPVTRLVAPSK